MMEHIHITHLVSKARLCAQEISNNHSNTSKVLGNHSWEGQGDGSLWPIMATGSGLWLKV